MVDGIRTDEPKPQPMRLAGPGAAVEFSPAAERAVTWAMEFYDRQVDPATGHVRDEGTGGRYDHGTLKGALGFLLRGDPGRAAAILRICSPESTVFNAPILVLMLKQLNAILTDEARDLITTALLAIDTSKSEDIVAGRNNNIPLLAWTTRAAQGVLRSDPARIEAVCDALERLTHLVALHGTLPEFNSPTYHVITLSSLRAMVLLGDERIAAPARRLEQHLWREVAWRYHPELRALAGPWGRAYHDSMVGASGLVPLLLHVAWDALFDPTVAYPYRHAHDTLHGVVFPLVLQHIPVDERPIALGKQLPVTVTASCEQVQRKLGDSEHRTWVAGGIADLTTWLGDHLALGTASRPHVHGMQNACCLAQWSRTGRRVERLADFGQAFARCAVNGRRPGDATSVFHHHHDGRTLTMNECLWGDDGRPYALQSDGTAVVQYLPRQQERWTVQRIEIVMALPRLDTIDRVFVDGVPVDEWTGSPDVSVVIRSGGAALGLRFAACDPCPGEPRVFVERSRDHLLVGLRTLDLPEAAVMDDDDFLHCGGAIGVDLRYLSAESEEREFVAAMQAAVLRDRWHVTEVGGPLDVDFAVGGKRLAGRFDPIGECWLERVVTPSAAPVVRMSMDA